MKKNKLDKKLQIIILCSLVILGVVGGIYGYKRYRNNQKCGAVWSDERFKNLPSISREELLRHDGIKTDTLYIGYHCVVYDVTEGKEKFYGETKAYHYLVARDATKQLEIFGGDIIEEKYPAVGILEP